MKFFLAALVFLVACSSAATHERKIFDNLAGLWQMNTDEGSLYEEWTKNEAGRMFGKTYMINGADSMVFEKVELLQKDSGVYYIPVKKGQNNEQAVSFKMIAVNDSSFTFENKAHDFPQRIIYRFVNNDSLVARIEGDKNGTPQSQDYYYSRVKK